MTCANRKMVCATRQNDVRSWQNGMRAISDGTDVLGKMMCALMCALVCALMCATGPAVPVAQRISFHPTSNRRYTKYYSPSLEGGQQLAEAPRRVTGARNPSILEPFLEPFSDAPFLAADGQLDHGQVTKPRISRQKPVTWPDMAFGHLTGYVFVGRTGSNLATAWRVGGVQGTRLALLAETLSPGPPFHATNRVDSRAARRRGRTGHPGAKNSRRLSHSARPRGAGARRYPG